MRLLHVRDLTFHFFPSHRPKYAIASHRWTAGGEAMLKDVTKRRNVDSIGYKKVEGFAKYVRDNLPGIDWLWIDTCCIDQKASSEVSEAVRSMFNWYRDAEICLAYLADVDRIDDMESFGRSEWHRRGWTLQELLAPHHVVFLTRDWHVIGRKGKHHGDGNLSLLQSSRSLEPQIATITGVPQRVLLDFSQSQDFSIEEKLNWTTGRETTRGEDMAYCLFGILNAVIRIDYGEGKETARSRLLTKARKNGKHLQNPPANHEHCAVRPLPSSTVPMLPDPAFIERRELLDQIQIKMSVDMARVALVGLGGVGKTQLLVHYLRQVRQQSPETWVLWIHASNTTRFEQSLRDIAERMKIPGREGSRADVYSLLRNWLSDSRNGKWLVALDNVDDATFLLESPARSGPSKRIECIPVCEHGSVLITSRSVIEAVKLVYDSNILKIPPMDEAHSQALLGKRLADCGDSSSNKKLAAALDYMPLAMAQAAAYIRQRTPRCTVRQYLDEIQVSRLSRMSLLRRDPKFLDRYEESSSSILLTWQISFEYIQSIRRSAADLLSLISFCDRQAIPESLMHLDESRSTISNDGQESTVDGSNADIGSDVRERSQNDFRDDLALLQSFSFISCANSDDAHSNWEVHRLVQDATRMWLADRGCDREHQERFICQLAKVCPKLKSSKVAALRTALFPHARRVADFQPQGEPCLSAWSSVMWTVSYHTYSLGYYTEAEALATSALDLRILRLEQRQREQHPSQNAASSTPSSSETARSEAVPHVTESEVQRRARFAKDPLVLDFLMLLAGCYSNQGRYAKTENFLKVLLEVDGSAPNSNDSAARKIMRQLAKLYTYEGRWQEAEKMELEMLQSRMRRLGPEHSETLGTMRNLANIYQEQGRHEEAEQLIMRVVKTRTALLGPQHALTLVSKDQLSGFLLSQRRYDEAEVLSRQVLEAQQRLLGAEHRATLNSMGNLALVFQSQKRWQEAAELERKELAIRLRISGAESRLAMTCMQSLAYTNMRLGHCLEAQELMAKAYHAQCRLSGKDHPQSLEYANDLATTYLSQRDWAQAVRLLESIIDPCRDVLGAKHKITKSVTSDLKKAQREIATANDR